MNSLQLRLVDFAANIYEAVKPFMKEQFLENVIKQIIKSSTSVGANYSEAQSASSKRDFHNKVRIALKELQETAFWLKYISRANSAPSEFEPLENETQELLRILSTIAKKTDPALREDKIQGTKGKRS